jgi:cobalt-precorrin-5B (C1)-methyltransferase
MTIRSKARSLRTGYTTGSCAAAAARAAVTALIGRSLVRKTRITLPDGGAATFPVKRCTFNTLHAECSVIKDAGDDPDSTNGAEIVASATWRDKPGIIIKGGTGVGKVTKPGLPVPVGEAAINPVPMQMISNEVGNVLADANEKRGVDIAISVPNGVALAKRTLNGRLGIIGGISILGTTGIVVPYSVDAYLDCISHSLNVAVACGCGTIVMSTGRRSEKHAQKALGLAPESYVLSGDYIGYSLAECAGKAIPEVIVWSMIGKMSKLAQGSLYTNVSASEVDMDFLIQVALGCGLPVGLMDYMRGMGSASHFLQSLPPDMLEPFAERICKLAARTCSESAHGSVDVTCVMADYDGNIVGKANGKK